MIVKTVFENINRPSMNTKSDPVKKKHKMINDSKIVIKPKKVTFEKVNQASVLALLQKRVKQKVSLPPERVEQKVSNMKQSVHKTMSISDAKIKLEANKRATGNTNSNFCLQVERTLKPTNLKFEVSVEAANHNAEIFMENGNNLQNVMNVNDGTSMNPGSEFWQIKSATEILGFHRDWTGIHANITKGCTYSIEDVISPEDQKIDLAYMMKLGNHKSSPEGKEIVEKRIQMRLYIIGCSPCPSIHYKNWMEQELSP